MDEDSRLGPELLKENGIGTVEVYSEQWREIEKILKRDRRRARLLMWCFLVLLTVGLVCIMVTLTAGMWYDHGFWGPYERYDFAPMSGLMSRRGVPVSLVGELLHEGFPILGGWCLCLSLVFGVAWFIYSRGADQRALSVRLKNIEMLLREGTNQDR